MMCAAVAGRRGRRVVLLERNERVGKKIQISGGGRCNFTNLHAQAENYLSTQPDFCKSALARYTPHDFIRLVESHGIAYHEKKLGQQFCDTSSREIIEMLVDECLMAQVLLQTDCRVSSIRRSDRFEVDSNLGRWTCDSLVVATGGLSFPKLGATDFGYGVAKQFGLAVTELRPGLVPLTFADEHRSVLADLSGISLPVTLRHRRRSFTENLLITHRGWSGPAILQISSYWREGERLEIDLLPGRNGAAFLRDHEHSGHTLEQALRAQWPERFAKSWSHLMSASRPLAQLSGPRRKEIGEALNAWTISPAETEGYARAEVTLGGVATSELSSKTMEARRVPGLYFIGEVVDVTGWLGGYNFQWAWSSAQAAGRAV
jgi:predicted Rossmann fold flavoprotein